MDMPRNVPGMCPHFDHRDSRCGLSGFYQDGSTREYHCKSNENCKTCGNYEAWASGRNYRK
jgi:hypothetical protein